MSEWHINPDGSASLDVPPVPDDISNDPVTAAYQMGQAMKDAYPEWVCAECGKSLFDGPVFAGKDNIFQPPQATCSPEHGKLQGSTLYDKLYADTGEEIVMMYRLDPDDTSRIEWLRKEAIERDGYLYVEIRRSIHP